MTTPNEIICRDIHENDHELYMECDSSECSRRRSEKWLYVYWKHTLEASEFLKL